MEGLSALARLSTVVMGPVLVTGILFLETSTAFATDSRSWKNPLSSPSGASAFGDRVKVERSRWTLKEWLEQKDRNRMMDLWLGMYAPSPYELILGVSRHDYSIDTGDPSLPRPSYKSWVGDLSFYALILGVQAIYESNTEEKYSDLQGYIHLRLMGNSNQSTHFNFFAGLRNRFFDGGAELTSQAIVGAEFDLYIEKHWGLHSLYRQFLPKEEGDLGKFSGKRVEGGLFIEISRFRIFGQWFSESLDQETSTTLSRAERTGWQYGLKAFF